MCANIPYHQCPYTKSCLGIRLARNVHTHDVAYIWEGIYQPTLPGFDCAFPWYSSGCVCRHCITSPKALTWGFHVTRTVYQMQ